MTDIYVTTKPAATAFDSTGTEVPVPEDLDAYKVAEKYRERAEKAEQELVALKKAAFTVIMPIDGNPVPNHEYTEAIWKIRELTKDMDK